MEIYIQLQWACINFPDPLSVVRWVRLFDLLHLTSMQRWTVPTQELVVNITIAQTGTLSEPKLPAEIR